MYAIRIETEDATTLISGLLEEDFRWLWAEVWKLWMDDYWAGLVEIDGINAGVVIT